MLLHVCPRARLAHVCENLSMSMLAANTLQRSQASVSLRPWKGTTLNRKPSTLKIPWCCINVHPHTPHCPVRSKVQGTSERCKP